MQAHIRISHYASRFLKDFATEAFSFKTRPKSGTLGSKGLVFFFWNKWNFIPLQNKIPQVPSEKLTGKVFRFSKVRNLISLRIILATLWLKELTKATHIWTAMIPCDLHPLSLTEASGNTPGIIKLLQEFRCFHWVLLDEVGSLKPCCTTIVQNCIPQQNLQFHLSPNFVTKRGSVAIYPHKPDHRASN